MRRAWPRISIALLLVLQLIAAAEAPDIVGEAVDPDSGRLLYLEHYYCSEDALECSVFYLQPDDYLIASKQIDYRSSLQAPGLLFNDFRLERELSKAATADPELVVDAGFDNYVRGRWDELSRGDKVTFPFLLLDRDEPLKMRAFAPEDADCKAAELCLQVRLDSWLLGMVVPPIELTYDREQRRLLRYRGVSNIRDGNGDSQAVEITYSYQSDTQPVSR